MLNETVYLVAQGAILDTVGNAVSYAHPGSLLEAGILIGPPGCHQ